MAGVLIRRGNLDKDIRTHGRRGDMRGHSEKALQAKNRGLRRNQPCWHLVQDSSLRTVQLRYGFETQSVFLPSCCCSVAQLRPNLCDPMDCSTPGFPVHHQLLELTQTHVHRLVMPSNHLILCRPLLLLPSIFSSIRVFSNESVLRNRWPKY